MDFPRTLLLSWQRPDGRYAGAEVLRNIVAELQRERLRWAYLAPPAAGVVPGLPEHRAFPPRMLPWRLRRGALSHWFVNNLQAGRTAAAVAAWVEPFRPQIIWTLAEMGSINVAYRLSRLGAPVHATVHDSYRFARFALPRAYYPVYRRDARRLLARVRSLDTVSDELMADLCAFAPMPALAGSLVFPPSIAPAHMAEAASRPAARGKKRTIGLCGSLRIDAAQWREFLSLLEGMPFEIELMAFADRTALFAAPLPANVTLALQDYARSEADVVRRFNAAPADACYLGLTYRPDQRMFTAGSLSSKLTTYSAAACPVIVHGPAEGVAWRLVSSYEAGIRVGGATDGARDELRRLLEDEPVRLRLARGAARLCRAEFDLSRHAASFAERLRATASVGPAERPPRPGGSE